MGGQGPPWVFYGDPFWGIISPRGLPGHLGGEALRKYEINVLLSPNLDPNQLNLEKELIARALEAHGAQVEQVEELGMRRLAYPIAKERQAYFLVYRVNVPEDKANALAQELRLRDNVHRVMLVRAAEPYLAKG